jgi:hypothetical protein
VRPVLYTFLLQKFAAHLSTTQAEASSKLVVERWGLPPAIDVSHAHSINAEVHLSVSSGCMKLCARERVSGKLGTVS